MDEQIDAASSDKLTAPAQAEPPAPATDGGPAKPPPQEEPSRPLRFNEAVRTLKPEGGEASLLEQLGQNAGFALFPPSLPEAQRTIRADVLRILLMGLRDDEDEWRLDLSRLEIEGAIVSGVLELEGIRRQRSGLDRLPQVSFVDCRFLEPPRLNSTEFDRLEFRECEMDSLYAYGLRVSGSFAILDCVIPMYVYLIQARIDGDCSIRCVRNDDSDHSASVFLDRATINGDLNAGTPNAYRTCRLDELSLTGATITGDVILAGAEIGVLAMTHARVDGTLSLSDAKLGQASPALDFSGATIGFANLRNLTSQGAIHAMASTVHSDINLDGAHILSPDDYALSLSRARVRGGLYIKSSAKRGFEAQGLVSLRGLEVDNVIKIQDARFSKPVTPDGEDGYPPVAIDLRDIMAHKSLEMRALDFGEGVLALEGARIRELAMDRSAWPAAGRMIIDELQYDTLELTEPMKAESAKGGEAAPPALRRKATARLALDWMRHGLSAPSHRGWRRRRRVFAAQPFEQLSKTLRAMGFGREADKVAIAKRSERIKCCADPFWSRQLSRFMGLVAGHGYSTSRAVVSTLTVTAIGTVAIGLALGMSEVAFVPIEVERLGEAPATTYVLGLPQHWMGMLAASLPETASAWLSQMLGPRALAAVPHGCPALVAPLYALDLIVPVLDLGQESACRMETRGVVGGWIQAGRVAYQILGAVMTAILITTLTGVLRRD